MIEEVQTFNISFSIPEVKTFDLNGLEILVEMMNEILKTMCQECDMETIREFGPVDYEMVEVKE